MSMLLIVFFVCLSASVVGAICGIGGGAIIKPVLDALQIMTVEQVSFLSGCMVMCMSAYSVIASKVKRESELDGQTAVPMGLGAAIGGIAGKLVFQQLSTGNGAGPVQTVCFLLLTVGALLYTVFRSRIKTYDLSGSVLCVLIGLSLGCVSSFLGIGGGPVNLIILSFFFSMEAKKAAKNSLCIILISQIASLLFSVLTKSVPDISWGMLAIMALAGISGGMIGRLINKRIDAKTVRKVFIGVNLLIIGVCIYNLTIMAS